MNRLRRALAGAACVPVLLAGSLARAQGQPPGLLSPGNPEGTEAAASTCPTFSWTRVDGASGYELVVYETTHEVSELPSAERARNLEPLLRKSISGDGLSWTPPAESCLDWAGSYAWSVRALAAGESSDWSEALLFEVEPSLSLSKLGDVLERAIGRYLERRGVEVEPNGELARLIADELSAEKVAPSADTPATAALTEMHQSRQMLTGETPEPRGVFVEDAELWLEETGSGTGDRVQLVFATPEFDGDPTFGDAWSISVDAEDTSDDDDGSMLFSTPGFISALQLFTDGSVIIGDLRRFRIRPSQGPPFSCTSALLQGGMVYYDSDINTLCVCDGSSWAPIDSDNPGTCS